MDAKNRNQNPGTASCPLEKLVQNAQGESRTITGRAIVFNAESEGLDDWGYRFREVMGPEGLPRWSFLNSQDIKMNMLHDRDLTLARCNKGNKVRAERGQKGVNFDSRSPECDIGDRCLEMVRRGVLRIARLSWPEEYDVQGSEGGKMKITSIPRSLHSPLAWTRLQADQRDARELYDQTPAGKADIEREQEQQERERIIAEQNRRIQRRRLSERII